MLDNEIEKTPIKSTKPEGPKQVNPRVRGAFYSNVGALFAVFGVIVLMLTLAFVIEQMFSIDHRLTAMVVNLNNDVSQSKTTLNDAQKNITTVQQSVQQVSEEVKTQGQMISDLRQSEHTDRNQLRVAEAEYLVKTADVNLRLQNNPALAIKLLQAADQEISELTDPKVAGLRKVLAADIDALQKAEIVDIDTLYPKLSAINDQIDKLPLVTKTTTGQVVQPEPVNSTNLSWWRRAWLSVKQAFQQMVVVRKNETNLPFVTSAQQVFVYQNLHAQIEQAEWALLHRQPGIFRDTLQQAINLIKQYAVQTDKDTQDVLANLTQLQQVNIQPTLPAITNSVQAFQGYFAPVAN